MNGFASRAAKRSFDVVAAAALLVLTAPLSAAIALLVRRDLGRPVLFRQSRPGLHGRLFVLVKFRTMREPSPGEGVESDAARVTTLGRFLRSTSLDELPTLLNVVRGHMSLVGPRPLLPEYLPRYSREQARRHEVRPGITGLAQIAGRNSLDWDERLRLDVEYVDTRTFGLDLRILAATAAPVLGRRGISAEGHATMHEFKGGGAS